MAEPNDQAASGSEDEALLADLDAEGDADNVVGGRMMTGDPCEGGEYHLA